MPAAPALPAPCLSPSALCSMLRTERDPHTRQRELVRASLVSRPRG